MTGGNDILNSMQLRWMSGGTAFEVAPPDWKSNCGELTGDAQERYLLALAGQLLPMTVSLAFPGSHQAQPPFPPRKKPPPPETARKWFTKAIQNYPRVRMAWNIIRLLEVRGFSPHPTDWMPDPDDKCIPDDYMDWAKWNAAIHRKNLIPQEPLHFHNWDDFSPAQRVSELKILLGKDRSAALNLLKAKISTETAPNRIKLLDPLNVMANTGDLEFLNALQQDKSAKVREKVHYLVSLAKKREDTSPDEISDLSQLFTLSRAGFFNKRKRLKAIKLPGSKSWRMRHHLVSKTSFEDFASTFHLHPDELLSAWEWGHDKPSDIALLEMVAKTGASHHCDELFDIMMKENDIRLLEISKLSNRLRPKQIRNLTASLLNADIDRLAVLYNCWVNQLSWLDAASALNSPLLNSTLAKIRDGSDFTFRSQTNVFDFLGLIATKSTAEALLKKIKYSGHDPAHHVFSLLQLNAHL